MVEKSKHVDDEMDKVMREIVPRPASGHVPRMVPLGLSIQTMPPAMFKSSDSSMSIMFPGRRSACSDVMEIEKSDTAQVEGSAAGEEPEEYIIAWGSICVCVKDMGGAEMVVLDPRGDFEEG